MIAVQMGNVDAIFLEKSLGTQKGAQNQKNKI